MLLSLYTKYGILLLWTLQMLLQTRFLGQAIILKIFFLGSLFLSFFLFLKNRRSFLHSSFAVIHIVLAIYIIYWLAFDRTFIGLQYIIAKMSIFFLITTSIYFQYDYIIKNYPKFILIISTIILFAGVLVNHNYLGGRYEGPFGNPNSLGFLSVLSFAITYFTVEHRVKKTVLIMFFLAMVFMSGSRAALGGVMLAFLLKDGVSLKKISTLILASILLIGANKIANSYGITTGLDRVTSNKNEVLSGRDMEWKLGFRTILDKAIEGNGLDKYSYISPKILRLAGVLRIDPNFVGNPHNSFIALFVQLGIPFGFFLFLVLLYYVIKSLFFNPKNYLWIFLFLYPYLSGVFESHLFGINGYEGTTFWFAIVLYQYYIYKVKENNEL